MWGRLCFRFWCCGACPLRHDWLRCCWHLFSDSMFGMAGCLGLFHGRVVAPALCLGCPVFVVCQCLFGAGSCSRRPACRAIGSPCDACGLAAVGPQRRIQGWSYFGGACDLCGWRSCVGVPSPSGYCRGWARQGGGGPLLASHVVALSPLLSRLLLCASSHFMCAGARLEAVRRVAG